MPEDVGIPIVSVLAKGENGEQPQAAATLEKGDEMATHFVDNPYIRNRERVLRKEKALGEDELEDKNEVYFAKETGKMVVKGDEDGKA